MNWTALKQQFSPTQRFNRDALWNLGSLAILAAAGIVLNFIVAKCWSKDALGVFNQVYAIYIVLSQLAVGGVHASVLREVSYAADDLERGSYSATSGIILSAVIGGVVCLVCFPFTGLVAAALDSEGVGVGLVDAIPGVFFFSLNKVLLNVLNGVRHMRAYAIFSAIRFLLILLGVVVIYVAGVHFWHLAAAFSAAEVILFFALAIYIRLRLFRFRVPSDLGVRMRGHFSFGARGVLSGLVSDLNTRLDAIMLGAFRPDAVVGLYSMASMLAEGIFQIPVVIQRNVNPIIGRAFAEDDMARIEWVARKTRRVMYLVMAAIAAVAIVLYPFAMRYILPDKGYDEAAIAFAILLVGIVIQAGVAPMGAILFQGGRPGAQTVLMVVVVFVNGVLNLVLIPPFGINGAAMATGVAYILQGVLTVVFAKRYFGVNLLK